MEADRDRAGIYFSSNPEVASGHAIERRLGESEEEFGARTPNVRPVFLDFKNPLVVDAKGAAWDKIPAAALDEAKGKPARDGGEATVSTSTIVTSARIRDQGEPKWDSVIVRNVEEAHEAGQPGDTYVALDASQVVSQFEPGAPAQVTTPYAREAIQPEPSAPPIDEQQVSADITDIVNRIAPGVRVEAMEAEGGVTGEFRVEDGEQIIRVALDGNPEKVVRHEAIHSLKNQGLFTDPEWSALVNETAAKKWVEKHKIEERYPDLFENGNPSESAIEEAIAEEFTAWVQGRPDATKSPAIQRMQVSSGRWWRRCKSSSARWSGARLATVPSSGGRGEARGAMSSQHRGACDEGNPGQGLYFTGNIFDNS